VRLTVGCARVGSVPVLLKQRGRLDRRRTSETSAARE
jgi:hypothetical protein